MNFQEIKETLEEPYISNSIEIANFIILFLTLLFLMKYTRATDGMKKEMVKQNRFNQRPIINLYFRDESENKLDYKHFAIRNVGNGSAYNISVDDVPVDEDKHWFAFDVGEDQEFNNVILEKERDEKPVIVMGRTKNREEMVYKKEAIELLLKKFNLLVDYSEKEYKKSQRRFMTVVIRYKGLDNRQYFSVFKVYQKHPSVTDRIIEFIKSEEGNISYDEAVELCNAMPKSKSIVEKMFS